MLETSSNYVYYSNISIQNYIIQNKAILITLANLYYTGFIIKLLISLEK